MQLNEDGEIEFDRHTTHNLVSRCNAKCTICLGPFAEEPTKAKHSLSCGHTYHTECILTWFRAGNPSCPLCRDEADSTPIVTPSEAVRQLKKISKRKSAPSRLKRSVKRLQKAEEQHARAKRALHTFEQEHAAVLKEVGRKRRKLDKSEQKISTREMLLIMPDRPYKDVVLPLIIFPQAESQNGSTELSDFFVRLPRSIPSGAQTELPSGEAAA